MMMPETAQLEFTPAALTSCVSDGLAQLCQQSFEASLRAVILTGSMARDEVSYTFKTGQALLLSDVEAIVVLNDNATLPSRQSNATVCKRIEQHLAGRGVLVHVGLSFVHGAYLRNLPPHIYSYELRSCGLVVFGEPAILEEIPAYAASDLTLEDAWRLLSNRLIEQMEIVGEPGDANQQRYRSIKLCLDLAASLLVFAGQFEAGYCARLQRIEEFALTSEAVRLPFPVHEFLPLLRQCTRAKLHPDAADTLAEGFVEQITGWAWQAWIWQLQRMTGLEGNTDAEEMIRAFGRSQGIKQRLRGWLYVARRTGWFSSAQYWPKWLTLFARKLTPRHAICLAAYRWQESASAATQPIPQPMKYVCELLPVAGAAQPDSPSDVSRQIRWNYYEFVTETRA